MTRTEQLNKMYDYARANGLCSNRKTFAALINMNEGNMSSAFSGNSRYLTTNLLLRVNSALNNAFNTDWLLNGNPPMLRDTTSSVIITNTHSGDSVHTGNIIKGDHNNVGVPASATIQEYQRIIEEKDRLIATLQSQIAELKADKENLMRLLNNLTTK